MKLNSLLAAAALACTVIGGTAQAEVLRWAAQNDILTLDPHSQNHATTNAILQHAYEGLTRYNQELRGRAGLATKWTQISPTQVRFDLRKDVKFHDGSPFTADDVVFSFGRIKQPQGTMQIYVTGISEIKKIDDYTVDLILSAPNPVLLRNIVDFRIMSKAWSEKNKTTERAGLQGQGRHLRLAQRQRHRPLHDHSLAARQAHRDGRQQRLVGQARRQRHRGDLHADQVRPDARRRAALGRRRHAHRPADAGRGAAAQDKKLKVLDGAEVRTIFIALDQCSTELKYSDVKGKNPFKDKRVREALNLAVDREAIKRSTMRGLSMPAGDHGRARRQRLHAGPRQVPAKVGRRQGAKKLLAEAGYPNGFEFQLNCPNNRYVNDEEICQALVGMWARSASRSSCIAEGDGDLHREGAELRHLGLHARLGRGHLRRPVLAAVAGAHAHHRRRRQLQLRPRQRRRSSTS